MRLPDHSALRSFAEGIHASILRDAVNATDPLELFFDEIFGPRIGATTQLPTAKQMWAALTERRSTAGFVAAAREHFPLFVRDRYGELLRPAWSKSSRAAAFMLLRRHVADPDAWRYLGLRFGFAADSTGTMTHEEIGRRVLRGKGAVDLAVGIAISTIRASRDADVLRQLSGRAP